MAVVRDRKAMAWGMALMAAFLALLAGLFSPVLDGRSPLDHADRIFSGLTKGSTHGTDALLRQCAAFDGRGFEASLEPPTHARATVLLLEKAGCRVEQPAGRLVVRGDLGALGRAVARDAEDMYRNDDDALRDRYALDGRLALYCWWQALDQINTRFKRCRRVDEADFVNALLTRGVEASYNFYGTQPARVQDRVPALAGLLALYVVYTAWCGGALYLIFRGLGLKAERRRLAPADPPPANAPQGPGASESHGRAGPGGAAASGSGSSR